MIYVKIAICRRAGGDRPESESDRGTAEFMFRDLSKETATRLALLLVRTNGWRAVDIVQAIESASRAEFRNQGRLQSMFDEAERDDVACAINASRFVATVEA
jgi:hypothetical protein